MVKGENIEEIVRTCAYLQPEPDMCWSAAIKFILKELSIRHANNKLNIGLRTINRICGYRKGFGLNVETTIPALNRYFSKNGLPYEAREVQGKDHTTLIKNIIENEEYSFPIVNMDLTYFKELKDRYQIPGDAEDWVHVIVVLKMNDDVIIYDPFEAYLFGPSYNFYTPKTLRKSIFIEHWRKAAAPYWLMWIKRKGKSKKERKNKIEEKRKLKIRLLDEYGVRNE